MKRRKTPKAIAANRREIEGKLRRCSQMNQDELFDEMGVGPAGLSAQEAALRQRDYGPNVISASGGPTIFKRLKEAVVNPFNIVLMIITLITYFTDVVYSAKRDYLTISILLALVVISSLVAFTQSRKSDKAAEKLSHMIVSLCDVVRGGERISIPMEEVVIGDMVRLSAGDMLPADVRFIMTKDIFVAQAALTGESNPVEKFSEELRGGENVTDLRNIGFMGSNIVSGSGAAIVVAVGDETYFGSMAKTLSGDRAKTSFEHGVDSVSVLLLKMMLIMVPVVFLVNGFVKRDWSGALLFSVSVAVGLTPEMLPVVMSSSLAKGAVNMSRHEVIVRNLGAIQAFGEMDILCTDKTGTLTEDKIVLEKYINVHGDEDPRILRHAYLNSYFQTGLKNLMDLAIINRANEHGLYEVLSNYKRVDEIPFDFTRRRMSVVLTDDAGKSQLITKGAVEEMLGISSYVELEGKVVRLDEKATRDAMATYEKYNREGLRIIAVAQKNDVAGGGRFTVADEKDMVLIGFVGFLDPPKADAKDAIQALRENGVRCVVLTGDSEGVALKVCSKVGINTDKMLTGRDIENLTEEKLIEAALNCDIFAKLSPSQKERVVKALQAKGHTVGYMGDGINDAPALRQADVGISVDSAVDIAKETADIILLKKDLMVLEQGVLEGRRTFGNIIKYIKMAASGNFGNMISVIIASVFLPFLPMLPVQLLTQNLLCDFSQMGIPFDRVDKKYSEKPRRWDTKSISRFMLFFGPLSCIFDLICFAVMWAGFKGLGSSFAPLFRCGWFIFGTISQVMVIHIIRTSKLPFFQSKPAPLLVISTFLVAALTLFIGLSDMATALDMAKLPLNFLPKLAGVIAGYLISVQAVKGVYVRVFGEWI